MHSTLHPCSVSLDLLYRRRYAWSAIERRWDIEPTNNRTHPVIYILYSYSMAYFLSTGYFFERTPTKIILKT